MRRLPPMGSLEAFVAAYRGGTLRAASNELNLSVSALSRRLQSLEAHVGRSLFERRHHELKPTPEGARLFTQIAPHFDAIGRILGEVRSGGERSLAIGVPPSYASAWLLPRLARFRARYPDITLRFDSSGAPFEKLGASLDAIIVFAETVPEGVDSCELKPQAGFAVCAPGLVAPGTPVREALRDHTLLLHGGLSKVLPLWLQAMGLDERAMGRTEQYDSGPMLIAAAEAGLGIALTLEDSVRFYEGDARLERPFGESVATPYSYWWVSRKPGASDVALRRFRDWLQAESAVRPEIGALSATA
jgi:LysR family glycine cleavage system transcriptional activator